MSLYTVARGRKYLLDALREHLATWIPAYFAEIARQNDLDDPLDPVRSVTYVGDNRMRQWPEDQLPCLVITSPGTVDKPRPNGDGTIDVRWAVGLGVVFEARDREIVEQAASYYADAIGLLILQHRKLTDSAAVVEFVGFAYDQVPAEKTRTLGAIEAQFVVEVRAAFDASGGPAEPPDDPDADPGDWPQIETTDIGITPVEEIA